MKRYLHSILTAPLFTRARVWKPPTCPSTYQQSIIQPWEKRKSFLLQQHGLTLSTYTSEINQNKYYMILFICGIHKCQTHKKSGCHQVLGIARKKKNRDCQRAQCPVVRWFISGNLMYSMVIIVYNMVLYTWNVLTTKKEG